ncbi:MAG: hypothetical protein B6U68_03160 [Candidatus Aenigmarchaeota archaeon ex4484_14]|nr:MAG: hypothetical protein B6U68_03160 [Candidatus Aenigmarchaeota archaeon ex4484_14]
MAYDRAIVVFSPEGRLYQVEYARQAVEKATTTLGVVFKNGVTLIAAKSITELSVPASSEKIFKIDEHIGTATCGLIADSRVLIDGAEIGRKLLMKKYKEGMSKEEAIKLGIETLKTAKEKLIPKSIEIGIVEGGKFKILSTEETKKFLKAK